ncbi:putative toxin-antitoxin system toxin component, PIN family [Algoriphagus taiwanensis]|uniref:Toxin-antitoxin system toxin component, PIN family n=1 Tax=Algoriphagus taiwanensis TaxID=1445656 RepID=A0ABQ6PX14_9BACT|nr:putative toxin-antitoxin system toxin component, PIN family [Algoriphagus taiwanensis]
MRVVLDTNILISALIKQGSSSIILNKVIEGNQVKICLSDAVWDEYQQVLKRPKFSKYPQFVENSLFLLHFLKNHSLYFQPKRKVSLIKDQSDNKFLELCLESKADYLITGNFQDFSISSFRNTLILGPSEFVSKVLSI